MAKAANANKQKTEKLKSELKQAKQAVQSLKVELKNLRAEHKADLTKKVSAAYDRAVEAAFIQFENKEIARDKAIEKAVDKAIIAFEKSYGKKAKTAKKKTPAKEAAPAAKKAPAKKKAAKKETATA